MLIGEIAKKTGFSRDTIRFYEKKELIEVGRGNSEWNNYKNYDDKALQKLFLIKKAKTFGFTLNEIAELLEIFDRDMANCKTLKSKVDSKLQEIDQKIRALKEMKKMIIENLDHGQRECTRPSKNNCGGYLNDIGRA